MLFRKKAEGQKALSLAGVAKALGLIADALDALPSLPSEAREKVDAAVREVRQLVER